LAHEYQRLKAHLASAYPHDRVAYTKGKNEFVARVTEEARRFYGRVFHRCTRFQLFALSIL
jgi:hypothetical protein